jgi:LAGLIDADG endonuclease
LVSSTGRLFQLPVFRNHKAKLGWQVQPTFVVVQSESSREVLEELVHAFGCGKVYINRRYDNHREDLYRYYVSRFAHLRDIIVPFSSENPLRSTKRDNFEKFAEIIGLMDSRSHLTIGGMTKIAKIVETMNHRKPSGFLRILRDHTPTVSL